MSPLYPFSSFSPHGSTHTVPNNLPDHISSSLVNLFFLYSLCFSCNTEAIIARDARATTTDPCGRTTSAPRSFLDGPSTGPFTGGPTPFASTNDVTRITAFKGDITTLRGTVNQMVADMVKLMALLKGPNLASSNSTPPSGYGPTVDPNPWVPLTHASESGEALVIHAPVVLLSTDLLPPLVQ
ncbi:hypothetical protein CRG98_015691 [Punica granatum]|uniref:Uncharacterized protein n=1 Tax=Punica granatum TaxID=22663 RepID=A0A2I0K6X7_PUNGR|nr:hypothetical protein CRG98_015691 [Punica granatum]